MKARIFYSVASTALIWLTLLSVRSVQCGDWPQFLGPHRNGISEETSLIDEFPKAGPTILWKIDGGTGMSGIAIVGDFGCTLIQDDAKQYLLGFDSQTGKPKIKTELAPAYKNSMGDGPRGTPVIDRREIFAYTGEGILCSIDSKLGILNWKTDVVKRLSGEVADYGMACSPILTEEMIIVTVGAPEATIAALERPTGNIRWTAGKGNAAGYSSPALLAVNGVLQLVVFHGSGVTSYYPGTGEELWSYDYPTDYSCNIATPLAVGDNVFISAGENHGSTLLKLPKESGGAATPVWESLGNRSVLRNEWQTSILLDGYLYGFDNVGSAGPVTHLTCINAQTGERVWQKLRFGKGNCIAADGKLWCTNTDGELIIVKATPEGYQELDRAPLTGFTRQAPAISNGKLYLRDGSKIVCVDIQK